MSFDYILSHSDSFLVIHLKMSTDEINLKEIKTKDEETVFETHNIQIYVEKLKNIQKIRNNLIDIKSKLKDEDLHCSKNIDNDDKLFITINKTPNDILDDLENTHQQVNNLIKKNIKSKNQPQETQQNQTIHHFCTSTRPQELVFHLILPF